MAERLQRRRQPGFCFNSDSSEEFILKTVFIGGSRSLSRLNAAVRQKLAEIVAKNCPIVIGDANGADKAVQKLRLPTEFTTLKIITIGRHISSWDGI